MKVSDTDTDAADRQVLPWPVLREVDVARMVEQHATLRGLCTTLEHCADALPARAAIIEAIDVSAALADCLRHHDFVESMVIGSLFESDPGVPMNILLGRIRHRHAVDHLHAEDLRDALEAERQSTGSERADALGYMMRCLFDGCRRGIDFQEAALLMLAHDRLTLGARAALSASLTGAI